jgi:hypothetical protein
MVYAPFLVDDYYSLADEPDTSTANGIQFIKPDFVLGTNRKASHNRSSKTSIRSCSPPDGSAPMPSSAYDQITSN